MDFIEQLKSSVDIVQVVGERVRLRKSGPARWVGLCPFHQEKTPSFTVHATHQFYKCFGCGAGGDVIKFVEETEGISFYEALKLLSERYGIPMPKRAGYADADTRLRAALHEMHELAEETFRKQLASPAGAEARAYLEKRGVAPEAVAQFSLGYADRSGRTLLRLLEQRNYTAEQLEASGLVLRRQDGGFYDRFRNRLMFPIHNETGKVIAFGGRSLSPEDEPKYLNSSETPIYRKSTVLYNLHRAKEAVRKADRVVLVEGYMDAIGVFAAGVKEVVATCGTALTAQQVQSMRRHSEKIVVNFDPDNAGQKAAERSIGMLLDEGMKIRVLELDGGLDPDEYCKERGADGYRAKLDGAQPYFQWLAGRAREKFGVRTAEERMAGLQSLLPTIQRLNDKLERMTVANEVAGFLGVDSTAVLEAFRRAAAERKEARAVMPALKASPNEKLLLNLLLASAEARGRLIPELKKLSAVEQFVTYRIFQVLFSIEESGGQANYNEVNARLDENDREMLAAATLASEVDPALSLDQGVECVRSLERAGRQSQVAALKASIRECERSGNLSEAIRLAGELRGLQRGA